MKLLKIPGINDGFAIPADEIIRVQAVSNYSRIYFSNGKTALAAKVLHWFEDSLPAGMFMRVHRSHLVNKIYVQQVKGGRYKMMLLQNGEFITISRRKNDTIEWYMKADKKFDKEVDKSSSSFVAAKMPFLPGPVCTMK